MIKLKSLLLENEWPRLILNDKYTWYHGRTVDSEIFSYDHIFYDKNRINQEGPGFYFTNSFENAKVYATGSGIILKCKINYKKLINKNQKSNTLAIKKIVVDLINKSPIRNEVLENFDENLNKAMLMAVNTYLQHRYAFDSYQLIQNDFYKNYPKEYLQVLSKYYDGQLTALKNSLYGDIYHLIVYNPSIITVLDKIKL